MSDSIDAIPVARQPRRRGSAAPAEIDQEFLDEDGKPIVRRSRAGQAFNQFEIPEKLKKAGWDYEWKTIAVLGDKEDPSVFVEISDGGWRAVKPEQMPGFMPADYEGKTIDRRGQRLFMRPMHLSVEAKEEAKEYAKKVRHERFKSAQMADPNAGEAARVKALSTIDIGYDRLPQLQDEVEVL